MRSPKEARGAEAPRNGNKRAARVVDVDVRLDLVMACDVACEADGEVSMRHETANKNGRLALLALQRDG